MTGVTGQDGAWYASKFIVDASNADDFLINAAAPGAGWNDINTEITIRGTGPNNPSFTTFRNGISAYLFVEAGTRECWGNVHIPHDYKPGTSIFLHVHWSTTNAAPAGNVYWQFEYAIAKGHGQEAWPATTTVGVAQACTAQYQHMVAETAAISSASLEPDSIVLVRLFRDGANVLDTATYDAHAFFIDIHYQKSKFGTKNKSPNFYT